MAEVQAPFTQFSNEVLKETCRARGLRIGGPKAFRVARLQSEHDQRAKMAKRAKLEHLGTRDAQHNKENMENLEELEEQQVTKEEEEEAQVKIEENVPNMLPSELAQLTPPHIRRAHFTNYLKVANQILSEFEALGVNLDLLPAYQPPSEVLELIKKRVLTAGDVNNQGMECGGRSTCRSNPDKPCLFHRPQAKNMENLEELEEQQVTKEKEMLKPKGEMLEPKREKELVEVRSSEQVVTSEPTCRHCELLAGDWCAHCGLPPWSVDHPRPIADDPPPRTYEARHPDQEGAGYPGELHLGNR